MHKAEASRVIVLIVFVVLCAFVALLFSRPAHGF